MNSDRRIGERAERETLAQLEIVRALQPLTQTDRARVLRAIKHLLDADTEIPGLFGKLLLVPKQETDATERKK